MVRNNVELSRTLRHTSLGRFKTLKFIHNNVAIGPRVSDFDQIRRLFFIMEHYFTLTYNELEYSTYIA
jgi:hypothetical protein